MTDPTPEQIQELKAEAQAAGDADMVTICDFAMIDLESDHSKIFNMIYALTDSQQQEIAATNRGDALERVAEVIDDARAQEVTTYHISAELLGEGWTDADCLETFAEELGKVIGGRVSVRIGHSRSNDPDLVTESQWGEAIDNYTRRMEITA